MIALGFTRKADGLPSEYSVEPVGPLGIVGAAGRNCLSPKARLLNQSQIAVHLTEFLPCAARTQVDLIEAKDFAAANIYKLTAALDYVSGYLQLSLAVAARDTPLDPAVGWLKRKRHRLAELEGIANTAKANGGKCVRLSGGLENAQIDVLLQKDAFAQQAKGLQYDIAQKYGNAWICVFSGPWAATVTQTGGEE